MGPAFEDVAEIRLLSAEAIEIILKRPSSLLLENLELAVQKPGTQFGTGPFFVNEPLANGNQVVLRRHDSYYGGQPLLTGMTISEYPSIRAAWADLLRGRLDMLYDVEPNALSSLESSSSVSVYTFPRPYQYAILLNTKLQKLRSPAVRRALNAAIDRSMIIRDALNGHGTEAVGPVRADHWGFRSDYPTLRFSPKLAASTLEREGLQITCLVPTDSTFERMTLMIKRQLESVGVQFSAQEASLDELGRALKTGDFDAVLIDVLMPTLARAYRWWHSQGTLNTGFASTAVDQALDRVRHATTDEEYRAGVEAFQRAIVDDPPAIFLAWSERARAVSTRFEVPVEEGRDILSTLRLWRPIGSKRIDTN
jgi:ABC-type transport system substrate-binding protein